MRGQTVVEGCLLIFLAVLLFCFPGQSAQAARKGVDLCLELIIPSLFPFFVLSSLLIVTGFAGFFARSVELWMCRLFGVGGTGASVFFLGLVGGYPVGARTLAQLVQRGECPRKDARRLSLFCNNCGPAFLISAAGVGIFGSREAGFLLFAANFLSAVALGLGLHLLFDRNGTKTEKPVCRGEPPCSLSKAIPDCVRNAFSATLGVCAYVILFSVLTTLADCSGLLPGGTEVSDVLCRSFFVGLMELSTGVATLEKAIASPAALPLAAFILSWGGLSVHCQTLPFWQEIGLSAGPYLLAKFLQGITAAGLTALGAFLFPLSLPAMAPVDMIYVPGLLQQELLALWALSGLYFLLTIKKSGNAAKKTI